jgi:hypothetical protein
MRNVIMGGIGFLIGLVATLGTFLGSEPNKGGAFGAG